MNTETLEYITGRANVRGQTLADYGLTPSGEAIGTPVLDFYVTFDGVELDAFSTGATQNGRRLALWIADLLESPNPFTGTAHPDWSVEVYASVRFEGDSPLYVIDRVKPTHVLSPVVGLTFETLYAETLNNTRSARG